MGDDRVDDAPVHREGTEYLRLDVHGVVTSCLPVVLLVLRGMSGSQGVLSWEAHVVHTQGV